ncbi:MAG: hypothetical protein AAF738_00520 [Bacteroidota bacterium]
METLPIFGVASTRLISMRLPSKTPKFEQSKDYISLAYLAFWAFSSPKRFVRKDAILEPASLFVVSLADTK